MIAGPGSGSKVAKAESLGVPVVDESYFERVLREGLAALDSRRREDKLSDEEFEGCGDAPAPW